MQIVGVVSDFYQESLHAPIAPLVIMTSTDRYFNGTFHIALKPQSANGDEWKTAIAAMQKSWKEIYPDDDFEYHFFDETIGRLYATRAAYFHITYLGYGFIDRYQLPWLVGTGYLHHQPAHERNRHT